jgi:DNA-binding XRE family transcriptional regulator
MPLARKVNTWFSFPIMMSMASFKLRRWRTVRPDAGRKITQQEVADAVGCTAAFIGQLETVERKMPSMALAARIAQLTGIDAGDWTKPALCGACSETLDDPRLLACTRADCPHLLRDGESLTGQSASLAA